MLNYRDDSITPFMEALERTRVPEFSLQEVSGFPYDEYQKNLARYDELWSFFSGTILDESVEVESNKEVDLYPVRVNPLVAAAYKHVYTLFGEIDLNDRSPVFPRIVPEKKTAAEKELAREAEDVLYRTWWENNSHSMMIENAIISQVFGGCVFRLRWDPTNPLRTIPIAIETFHPANFVGIPDGNDMWSLSEAWLVRAISPNEAVNLGVTIDDNSTAWLIEHITKQKIDVMINNEPATIQFNDDRVGLSTDNPFGFVPVVYIPHLRVFGFYGDSMISNLKGIVKELNLRIADYGDAVNTDAHTYVGMRNVSGTPVVVPLAANLNAINLQGTPALTGTEREPDLFDIREPSASAAMQDLYDVLYDQFRRDAYLPAIADGEDEGSQRSGLTLAMRMWPLVSHTNIERLFWTSGLNLLNRMILQMLLNKNSSGISIKHATLRIRQQWYPPLPRDREQQVEEAVARMQASLGSPEHLIEMLGDVEDPIEEVVKILDFLKQKAQIEAEAQAAAAPPPAPQSPAQQKKPAQTEPPDKKEK